MKQSALLLLAAIGLLAACKGKPTEPDKPTLVGQWKVISAEGEYAAMNKGTVYTFTDKKMSTSFASGNYTIKGDTIINMFDGQPEPFKYLHKFENGQLKMELLSSGGQKFVLEKH